MKERVQSRLSAGVFIHLVLRNQIEDQKTRATEPKKINVVVQVGMIDAEEVATKTEDVTMAVEVPAEEEAVTVIATETTAAAVDESVIRICHKLLLHQLPCVSYKIKHGSVLSTSLLSTRDTLSHCMAWRRLTLLTIASWPPQTSFAAACVRPTLTRASSRGPVPVLATGVFPLPAPGSGTACCRNCNGQTLSLANSVGSLETFLFA